MHGKFTGSKLDGVGGDVAWKYEDWLKGQVSVPDYTKIDKVSGTQIEFASKADISEIG